MTTLSIGIFVFLGLLTSTQKLWAAGTSPQKIEELAREFETKCNRMECVAPYRMIPLLRYAKPVSYMALSPENKKILQRIAEDQAQVWGDTILEGDYEAEGRTRLDQVLALYYGHELVGFLITYSEKAWDVFDCAYDGVRPSTLQNCPTGRIIESSYVSANFRDFIYTMKTAARFYPDKN